MAIKDEYYVVDFTFIDDYRCLRPLRETLEHELSTEDQQDIDLKERQLQTELSALFSRAGWEGDGEIACIFLAPCFSGRDDGWCDFIYHVKQRNNGISWLAIPKGLSLSLPEGFHSKP